MPGAALGRDGEKTRGAHEDGTNDEPEEQIRTGTARRALLRRRNGWTAAEPRTLRFLAGKEAERLVGANSLYFHRIRIID